MQRTYCPTDFGFTWTPDGWYAFDVELSQKAALTARNREAKRLRAEGRKVTCFSLPSQLRTLGGIGSGKPQIEVVVTVYGLNAY